MRTAHNAKDITGQRFGRLVALRREVRGKGHRKRGYWLCQCDCGNQKWILVSNLTRGLTESCGCLQRERTSKANGGANSPHWQGGIARRRDLYKERLRRWRKKIFKRDDYICQCCGKRGGKLHPHHIKSFANHPKLRLDPSNGITLCASCHQKFHAEYGQQHNTPKQLQQFLVNCK